MPQAPPALQYLSTRGSDMSQMAVRSALVLAALMGLPLATASAQQPAQPTFTKDIARIFQAKCESCHRPNSIAPMSLVTWEETRPWARAIRTRVASREMPPWHIDKTVG